MPFSLLSRPQTFYEYTFVARTFHDICFTSSFNRHGPLNQREVSKKNKQKNSRPWKLQTPSPPLNRDLFGTIKNAIFKNTTLRHNAISKVRTGIGIDSCLCLLSRRTVTVLDLRLCLNWWCTTIRYCKGGSFFRISFNLFFILVYLPIWEKLIMKIEAISKELPFFEIMGTNFLRTE